MTGDTSINDLGREGKKSFKQISNWIERNL